MHICMYAYIISSHNSCSHSSDINRQKEKVNLYQWAGMTCGRFSVAASSLGGAQCLPWLVGSGWVGTVPSFFLVYPLPLVLLTLHRKRQTLGDKMSHCSCWGWNRRLASAEGVDCWVAFREECVGGGTMDLSLAMSSATPTPPPGWEPFLFIWCLSQNHQRGLICLCQGLFSSWSSPKLPRIHLKFCGVLLLLWLLLLLCFVIMLLLVHFICFIWQFGIVFCRLVCISWHPDLGCL